MTDDIRQQAIALYDRFTHEGMERRTFMARMAGPLETARSQLRGVNSDIAARSASGFPGEYRSSRTRFLSST